MLQRCWEHDYCEPCFYMITVVTEPRRECFGEVVVPAAGAAAGTVPGAAALLRLSPMGEVVREVWRRTSAVYPGVEACECAVMPDHFHGILWVKERLARPMGHIVKAFKRVSEQECRSRGLLLPKAGSGRPLPEPNRAAAPAGSVPAAAPAGSVPAAAPAGSVPAAAPAGSVPAAAPAAGLWQSGFQDSILLRRGQLKAMTAYIADNPRRLAAKRANPALFTVVANTEVLPGKSCAAIGNRFLLQHPLKRQIQVSRRISPAELAALQEELLYAAEHGAVLVSPCISPGEKAIARAALEAGRPLIVMQANGFAPHYKPPGRYFDACAAGRLLMLAPFPHEQRRQTITREQCLQLNAWAQAITEKTCP
jgi:REP element-mobilizing transposase RayT